MFAGSFRENVDLMAVKWAGGNEAACQIANGEGNVWKEMMPSTQSWRKVAQKTSLLRDLECSERFFFPLKGWVLRIFYKAFINTIFLSLRAYSKCVYCCITLVLNT